ncbi:hypothetical protein ABZ863_01080 [Saccharomonospora sp. NPDC046836]|uniref:hypothetical protein n=1 Tax=Saccharomonospora sp. NPDC046836 TaxID=3156921 RepID=UPI0033E9B10B
MTALSGLLLSLGPETARATSSVTWTLHVPRADIAFATTTPEATGLYDFPARRLDVAVNTVTATVPGDGIAVDVRGQRADGSWSEWVEILADNPAVLPESTTSVQTRLVLTPGTAPRGVDLTAWHDGAARTAAATPYGTTFRLFATREGLVGGTTANGHVIVERDHFVALPSRRGLAPRGEGSYTVKVCTLDNARCEWAPVWDVGPWNTKDDHWNDDRESWRDLPHGEPQAQAAYEDGYNGGRDQFGRTVKNPAGIDLADGTFWDGLQLPTNTWVNVTYQWTGYGPWGTVETVGTSLNVRTAPTTAAEKAGFAASTAEVRIECFLTGTAVDGSQGFSDRWYRLAPGKYVAAAYVRSGIAPPPC